MEPATTQQINRALEALAKDRGDEDAWRALFTGSWPTGIATAHRVLRGQVDLARDVTQDAFHRIVRYCDFGNIHNAEAFLAYLRAVCLNLAKDAFRRLTSDAETALEDAQSPESSGGTPEELVATEELKQEFLALLDEPDQQLFQLLVAGFPLIEISNRMGLTYSNAGVRLHRLRRTLRNYLKTREL